MADVLGGAMLIESRLSVSNLLYTSTHIQPLGYNQESHAPDILFPLQDPRFTALLELRQDICKIVIKLARSI